MHQDLSPIRRAIGSGITLDHQVEVEGPAAPAADPGPHRPPGTPPARPPPLPSAARLRAARASGPAARLGQAASRRHLRCWGSTRPPWLAWPPCRVPVRGACRGGCSLPLECCLLVVLGGVVAFVLSALARQRVEPQRRVHRPDGYACPAPAGGYLRVAALRLRRRPHPLLRLRDRLDPAVPRGLEVRGLRAARVSPGDLWPHPVPRRR